MGTMISPMNDSSSSWAPTHRSGLASLPLALLGAACVAPGSMRVEVRAIDEPVQASSAAATTPASARSASSASRSADQRPVEHAGPRVAGSQPIEAPSTANVVAGWPLASSFVRGTVDDTQASEGPWLLSEQLALPEWLDLTLEQQIRYEGLDEDFRKDFSGSNQLWSVRHVLGATIEGDSTWGQVEIADVRALDVPTGKFISPGIVDALDLLTAMVGFRWEDAIADGDSLDLRLGRQTLDLGARRLVARNRFRATINAFTGAASTWLGGDTRVDSFAFMPVQRLPTDPQELRDNVIEFDEEQERTLFTGVHVTWPVFDDTATGELYGYGLIEDDEADVEKLNRRLLTLGGRVSDMPGPGEFGYDSETALQFGKSRASKSSTEDLDHLAWWTHLTVQYRFEGTTRPRLGFLFDWGTGDDDPNDGQNNRFDGLYGARVPELGPAALYGPFSRNNLISPGVRFEFDPAPDVAVRMTHRLYWLDSDTDFFGATRLRDATGNSGSFGGQGFDARVRYDIAPGNLRLEAGFAHLFAGEFMDEVDGEGDTTYFYVQTNLTL